MAEPKKLSNGRYEHRIRIKHPLTGKWMNRQTTEDTIRQCRDWEVQVRASVLNGMSPEKVTLLSFFDLWYTTFQEAKNGKSRNQKTLVVKEYLKIFFDETFLLKDVDKVKYQTFLIFLSKQKIYSVNRKSQSNKTLSKTTITDYHKICKSMFMEAMDLGLLHSNPARKATISGRDASKDKKKTLTTTEWKKLLKTILGAPESSSKYATLTMMFIGARFQEVDGLLVTDVNLKNKQINIGKAFDYKDTKDYTDTKNAGSKRLVDVPQVLADILKPYILSKRNSHKVVSLNSEKRIYLFPNELDIPITNNAINKFIGKCCKKAGIERITSHAFRHARTDMLVLAVADIIYTQKQLGHSNPSTTLKYYSALSEDIRIKNRNIQDEFLDSVLAD